MSICRVPPGDTEDRNIVKSFAAARGHEERLKLLCLMTVADIEAVSPLRR